MANIANCTFRSRLALKDAERGGPQGIHRNAQDFSDRSAQQAGSRQEFLRQNWEYLPPARLAQAARLSTSYKGVRIDPKSNSQFVLEL